MTIRHLQIFRAVCDCGGITQAAAALNMTQPAVSIAIRELESYYNTRLFDRIGRRIYLTEAGGTLRRYADSMLEQFDEAAAVLRDGGSMKRCRLGVNVSVGETILAPILKALEREVPGIRTEVFIGSTRTIERRLADNDIDIAVADCISESPERVVSDFYIGETCIVCSPGFAAENGIGGDGLTVERLPKLRLMLREEGSGSRMSLDALFRSRGLAAAPAVESASDLALLTLAKQGFGATILPRELVEEDISRGLLILIRLTDTELVRRYFIAYNKKKRVGVISDAIGCLEGFSKKSEKNLEKGIDK